MGGRGNRKYGPLIFRGRIRTIAILFAAGRGREEPRSAGAIESPDRASGSLSATIAPEFRASPSIAKTIAKRSTTRARIEMEYSVFFLSPRDRRARSRIIAAISIIANRQRDVLVTDRILFLPSIPSLFADFGARYSEQREEFMREERCPVPLLSPRVLCASLRSPARSPADGKVHKFESVMRLRGYRRRCDYARVTCLPSTSWDTCARGVSSPVTR